MGKAIDYKLSDDDDSDLFIDPETGDFKKVPSDTKHVEDIIKSYSGWWRESPTIGVGIDLALASPFNKQRYIRAIRLQMETDGIKVDELTINEKNEIFITGERKDVGL